MEEIKFFFFTDYMLVYIENSKKYTNTHKNLELISEFSKVACLHTQIKHLKQKLKTVPLTMASRKMKHLGVNLAKHVRDLYAKITKC